MKLVAVLALCTSCSFVMTKGPSNDPRTYPDCTTSATWPIIDVVLSIAFTSALIGAATGDDQKSNLDDGEANKASKVTTAALMTGLSVAGAVVGWRRISACRSERERFAAANPMGTTPPYAYPYGYQQQPYYPQQPTYQPPQPQPQPRPLPPAPPPVVPQQQPAASTLGIEGDVCAQPTDCSTGLTCTNHVCVRPPAR